MSKAKVARQGRLQDLKSHQFLDTPPEAGFDCLAGLAANICGTPIAAILLIDEERQWFESVVGLGARETDRAVAFCTQAMQDQRPLVVPDTRSHPLFADNPLVIGKQNIRFFAGLPLISPKISPKTSPKGSTHGALCVIDHVPRTLTDAQMVALEALADLVMTQLGLRSQHQVFKSLLTEHQQLVAFKAEQATILERIAANAPLAEVLNATIHLVESQYPASLCSVLLLDKDGRHLRHGAAPNLPPDYIRALDGVEIGPAVGSCGTAAFEQRNVIVEDIANDPLWVDYRDLALRHGLAACWSLPIFSSSRQVLGTFCGICPFSARARAGRAGVNWLLCAYRWHCYRAAARESGHAR